MPRSGILLASVEHREDIDRFRADVIDKDIVRMNNDLARARDAARSVDVRMKRQALRCLFER
jgi:hypothetical protein